MGTDPVPSGAPGALRRLLWPLVAALLVLAVLLALGSWQVARLNWKLDLIERVEQRVDDAPVAAPGPAEWSALTDDGWDYRPVKVTGRFLPGELYYYIALADPKGPLGGPGYLVYAPFAAREGYVVLVNRGFVPDRQRLPETRPGSAAPEGELTIEGLWRRNERGNFATVEADEKSGIWFVRESAKMAESLGVEGTLPVAPYTIDARASLTPPSGLPQAGETLVSFTNNHLQYAVTWFGLAAVLVVIFVVFARGQLRRP